jgi:regulator of sirC expression with transglutaminase-like and TPR domain
LTLDVLFRHPDFWQAWISPLYLSEGRDMGQLEKIRQQFADQAGGPEDRIDLVDAALLVARTAFPDLDHTRYTALLDEWADRLNRRVAPSASAGTILEELNRILFVEEGLQGDTDNYFDPQNSFLNRVLDRRLGIPITLSLVYSEVGCRAGFPVYGIALPGHFITALFHAAGLLFIDPFNQGAILTESECRQMVEARYGRGTVLEPGWKTPAGKKMILVRLLRNLKAIYRHLGRDLQVFEMIQWILAADPLAPAELKERGLLYEAMGNDAFAVRDLERYLEVAPAAADREEILQKINLLRHSGRWMH